MAASDYAPTSIYRLRLQRRPQMTVHWAACFRTWPADEVQRRVAADGVVEAVDVAADGGLGLGTREEDGPADESDFLVLRTSRPCRCPTSPA